MFFKKKGLKPKKLKEGDPLITAVNLSPDALDKIMDTILLECLAIGNGYIYPHIIMDVLARRCGDEKVLKTMVLMATYGFMSTVTSSEGTQIYGPGNLH